jgi:hypothetical protein
VVKYLSMAQSIDQLKMYWRFARGLREFLKEPISHDSVHETIKQRLVDREKNFLSTVKSAVYGNESSPYLKLLRCAGCEYSDLEKMVLAGGIEPTLKKLYQAGVYITLEEFKGRQEVVRGSNSFKVTESDFDAPLKSTILADHSGASRSAGTKTSFDFDHLYTHALHRALTLDVAISSDTKAGLWWPTLPGGGPKQLLSMTKAGRSPIKWFAQVSKTGSGPRLKNRLMTRYIVYAGRLCGSKWPMPVFTPLSRAVDVARWLTSEMKRSGSCLLVTYTSSAIRVCQAAKDHGIDIRGTTFIVGGEPLTDTKNAEILAVGAKAINTYAFVEAGIIGVGCGSSESAGDIHFFGDSYALIQHHREVIHSGVFVDAFLFTTLLPSAPKVFLNAESGDYGEIATRTCGCKLDSLGLTTHINNIRGFDKLTAEGMTLVGTDIVRIIEEVLPATYGGSTTDYQIVEEEDPDGHTRMSIIISPSIKNVDDEEVIRTVLNGLPRGGITPAVWATAGTFRVKRAYPEATVRGKLLPLHIIKRK